jgi:hypothetical protein
MSAAGTLIVSPPGRTCTYGWYWPGGSVPVAAEPTWQRTRNVPSTAATQSAGSQVAVSGLMPTGTNATITGSACVTGLTGLPSSFSSVRMLIRTLRAGSALTIFARPIQVPTSVAASSPAVPAAVTLPMTAPARNSASRPAAVT